METGSVEVALSSVGKISVSLIDPGNNPRKRFDVAYMEELEESIRAVGIVQPILIRPVGDRYKIVAGERRYRAFTNVHGLSEEVQIPVLIKEMSDAEADMSALVENVVRASMTPIEEAESAALIVGHSQGDRDEAARKLGWNRKFLDRRIALMYAVPEVRAALQEDKILLGHAELIAVLRKETQIQVLTGLLGAPEKMTVGQLKTRLENAALALATTIFDKTDCGSCQYSSANQQALFSEAITAGNCTNKLCYEGKTEAEIGIRAKALEADFQIVKIVRLGDNYTVVALKAEGPTGVGEEQATACRTCKDFGAVVSALPDKLGSVFKGMCHNTTCHTGMVAANILAKKSATETAAKAATKAAAATLKDGNSKASGNTAAEGETTTAKAEAAKPKAAASSAPSNALKEYREKVWRAVLSRGISKLDPETNQCVLLTLAAFGPRLLDSSSLVSAVNAASVPLTQKRTEIGDVLESALALDKTGLDKAISLIPVHISTQMEIRSVVGLLKGLDIQLKDHWVLNAEVLGTLTKNEIDATCAEIGIKAALGTDYSKLISGKKDDLVKAILSITGFEYKGRIPKQMNW